MNLILQHLSPPGTPTAEQTTLFLGFLLRLCLNMLAVGVLIRLIYYRIYQRSDLFLTFFTFNLIIFLITYLLNQVQMSIGAAFGLFAVFSMLRYRTQNISAKDMTYLFVVISIGLISAISYGGWLQMVVIHTLILGNVQLLETNVLFRRELSKTLVFDRIDLIRPTERPALLADLTLRTGLPVHRVDMQHIDLVKEVVQLTLYYYPTETHHAPTPSFHVSSHQPSITVE